MFVKRIKILLILPVISILLFGCGPSLSIPFTKPAEINLKGIKKIAVTAIDGQGGTDASDYLTEQLLENNRYEVVDRQNLEQIFREHNLTFSGAVDQQTAVKYGQMLGAQGFITGRVSRYDYKEPDLKWKDETDKDGKRYRTFFREGTATVYISLQVTDLRTGKIMAKKNLQSQFTETKTAVNEHPEKIDVKELLNQRVQDCARQFLTMITPQTVNEKVSFEKGDDQPEIKQGLVYVKHGDLTRAYDYFQLATERYPNEPAGYYNLGIISMCWGDYDKAISQFDQAYRVKPDESYLEEKNRAKKWKADTKKLNDQLDGLDKESEIPTGSNSNTPALPSGSNKPANSTPDPSQTPISVTRGNQTEIPGTVKVNDRLGKLSDKTEMSNNLIPSTAIDNNRDFFSYQTKDILINPKGTNGAGFLLANITLFLNDEASLKEIEVKESQLEGIINEFLSKKTTDELTDINNREKMALNLLDKIDAEISGLKIRNIFFGKYVVIAEPKSSTRIIREPDIKNESESNYVDKKKSFVEIETQYTVQLLSLQTLDATEKMVSNTKQVLPYDIFTIYNEQTGMYKICAGKYNTESEANTIKDKCIRNGYKWSTVIKLMK
jgi:tetratricopeptide (TPR) repeat protein